MVRFFDFSRYHGKNPPSGSTLIRVEQLIKYWPEAGLYKYGENPDVLIFQKVYISQDYYFPINFKGIKILDICDPDWLNSANIKQTVDQMNAVTCPTEALAKFLRQLTDKPVVVIKDRFDVSLIPEPKQHTEQAKTVVWFGYSHNAELIKPALSVIESLGLNLLLISNDDPIAYRWGSPKLKDRYKFIKYKEDTIYDELKQADFAILPEGSRPVDVFKSENKTIKANLAGLPVAHDLESVNLYMEASERQAFVDRSFESVKTEYDVRKSVEEYKKLIEQL